MGDSVITSPTSELSRGLGAFLRVHHGKVIVLIAQDLAHWYVGEIAASANQIAQMNGYHLISLDFHRSAEREQELLMAVNEVEVEGCIFLWDYFPQNLSLYQKLAIACIQIGDPKPIPIWITLQGMTMLVAFPPCVICCTWVISGSVM